MNQNLVELRTVLLPKANFSLWGSPAVTVVRTVRLCLQCLTAEDHQSHENVRHNFNKLLFVNKYDGNVNFTHGLGPPTRMSAPAAPSPTAYSGSVCLRFHLPNIPTANCATISPIKEMLHGTIFNATLLREKSIPCNMTINLLQQRCIGIWSLFKVVQHDVATNAALKIVCRRHVTRIDFLCNNVALKIVVKNLVRLAYKL